MKNNFFEVLRPGINTTYQDDGRFHMQHLGVAPGGCMDIKSYLIANKILSNQNICSKEWIWQQYDHTVMGDTIQKPGGDAGVVRVHGTNKAVAAAVDSSATYCHAHPFTGGKQVVCESWRNIISVGAKPIAITNCLNFGNPEKEKNMGEFVECVKGISEASKYLNYPVVSGNVSFYNETKDKGIKPTPSIGGIGLLSDYKKMLTMELKNEGNYLLVIGTSMCFLFPYFHIFS